MQQVKLYIIRSQLGEIRRSIPILERVRHPPKRTLYLDLYKVEDKLYYANIKGWMN